MGERGMFPASVARGPADVMVTVWNNEARADAIELAAELRLGGLRAEVYPETDRLGKQFKYAASCQVPFVAIVGDDERAARQVAIKDIRSGEQTAVPRSDAAAFIANKLNG
jgi:histidyl-tRNA synthetase